MTGAGLDLFMLTSFGRDKDVDDEMCAGGAVVCFQATWVADAALWIVHKTEQYPAAVLGAIPVGIDAELIGEVFGAQARARFFHDDGQMVLIQEECRARSSVCITRCPFVGADVVELETQKRVEQILYVELVFDGQSRSVFATESKLTSDSMKAMTESFHELQYLLLAVGLLNRRGDQRRRRRDRRHGWDGK